MCKLRQLADFVCVARALPGGVGFAGVSGPDEGAAGPARRCRTCEALPDGVGFAFELAAPKKA